MCVDNINNIYIIMLIKVQFWCFDVLMLNLCAAFILAFSVNFGMFLYQILGTKIALQ